MGARAITGEELTKWSAHLPNPSHHRFLIGTDAIIACFVPLFPIKTFVYYEIDSNVMSTRFAPCFYPAGEGKVYWQHVKGRWEFYLFPAGVLLTIANSPMLNSLFMVGLLLFLLRQLIMNLRRH